MVDNGSSRGKSSLNPEARSFVPQIVQEIEGNNDSVITENAYLWGAEFEPVTPEEILFQYQWPTDDGDSIQHVAITGEKSSTTTGIPNNTSIPEPELMDSDGIKLADLVKSTGKFNFEEARLPIPTHWNTQLFAQLLEGYEDKEVAEFIRYGWPIDRQNIPLPSSVSCNHKGASEFPDAVNKHIQTELAWGAIEGPFEKPPMEGFVVSPLNSRPKRNSNERRIIYDLSWPLDGTSVNAGVSKDVYLGQPVKLRYPTVRTFIKRIKYLYNKARAECRKHGDDSCDCDIQVYMYKRDWSRAFSQLGLDPSCYRYLGFIWEGKYYFSKVVPMGLVSACLACQRTTSAIRYIMNTMGFYLCNYIDDMVSAEMFQRCWDSYNVLGKLFRDLRVQESLEKAVPPTTEMEFVGNLLNTKDYTISVTPQRRQELMVELDGWLHKRVATRRELESVIGKLQFICNCMLSGRIFLNRLLNFLRVTKVGRHYRIPKQARADLLWWRKALQVFSGTSMMWLEQFDETDQLIAADACLEAVGGVYTPDNGTHQYFRCKFPQHLAGSNIAILELWGLIIAIQTWGEKLQGCHVIVHCDNQAVAEVVNSGRAKEETLQAGLREICFLTARFQCYVLAKFIPGELNRLPDLLSRWWKGESYRKEFRELAGGFVRRTVRSSQFQFSHDW